MTKRTRNFKVINNNHLTNEFFILYLQSPEPLPEISPGQFVQVRVDGSPETFLRRPISVYDVDYESNIIQLLIQVVGSGTSNLAMLLPGDDLNIVYPLGNSFSLPSAGSESLLVGGGVGIAPLFYLAKMMYQHNLKCDILLGFRNKDRIIEFEKFKQFGSVYITTEDGSYGEKGYVTGHSILQHKKFTHIYSCGPDPMMKSVAGYARKNNIWCEVSLENLMACGFGICLCCIAETTRGNICTCTEGPVFNISELKW